MFIVELYIDLGEKKLGKVIVQDKWKEGARNTLESGGRKIHENKFLSSSSKDRFSPYANKCKICKGRVHQQHGHYCQACAYKNGICAMCGARMLDVSAYKQSTA